MRPRVTARTLYPNDPMDEPQPVAGPRQWIVGWGRIPALRDRLDSVDRTTDEYSMNMDSLASALVGIKTAETMGQIQVAVAAKMLKTANEQGEAVLQLVEAATQNMAQASGRVASLSADMGANLDLTA